MPGEKSGVLESNGVVHSSLPLSAGISSSLTGLLAGPSHGGYLPSKGAMTVQVTVAPSITLVPV